MPQEGQAAGFGERTWGHMGQMYVVLGGAAGGGATAATGLAGAMPPSITRDVGADTTAAGLAVGDRYFSGSERKRSLHLGLQKKYSMPLY
jgi:hypothetical protein